MEKDNCLYIAQEIFSKPPQKPNTIQLQLDDDSITYGLNQQKTIDGYYFNMLTLITLYGIKILFNHNISSLDINQKNLVNEYTESFGYTITFNNSLRNYFSFSRCYK